MKTFAALGVYGTSAITAVTAQNTLGVRSWEPVSESLVVAQIEAVVEDIGADAVKIGMLGSAGIVHAVERAIVRLGLKRIVIDPVMIAKGGTACCRRTRSRRSETSCPTPTSSRPTFRKRKS